MISRRYVSSGDWTASSGEALADQVAARLWDGSGPTAVVVANDQMALGLIAGLSARGVDVPGSVSVTGFDAVDLPWLDRTLTTIVQPGEAKGRLLGELTRRRLAGKPPASEPFPVSLRVGDTTSGPR